MAYLTPVYDPWMVTASLLIACFASYVALDLAKRVATSDRGVAWCWWIGGAIAMGSGIWSMHFVGMLALSLPIALGYTTPLTLASWIAAVAASMIWLWVASREVLTLPRLAGGSLSMGAGICGMHYTGMASMDMSPDIIWDLPMVLTSAVIAVGASGAALQLFFWLRDFGMWRGLLYRAAAATVMGLAIGGMHYTGMAAAQFPDGTVCLSANGLSGSNLGMLVMLASATLLALTLFTSTIDARLQGRWTRLASSLRVANRALQTANEELQKRVFVDPLTGLPNSMLFEDRLKHAVAHIDRSARTMAPRQPKKLAVLFVDLDGFKPVNDSFGHAVGDVVLQEAALRLRGEARAIDTVARVGGDDFLLLMEDVDGVPDSMSLAQRLIDALARPFDMAGRQVQISCSVGVALYPDHGPRDMLVRHADSAMDVAKRAGGGCCAVFEAHMDLGALDRLDLHNDLRHAIALGQLELHYQPKVDGARAMISGAEALLRWHHPLRGPISPAVFIPIAERFGLINELGNWVIDEACRQMRAWADLGFRLPLAINVSVHQLRNDSVVTRIEAALHRHQIDASMLLCEVTESIAMEGVRSTQGAIQGLERIGVYLSIDDFGTGYSSLSYLRQLPARQLKIDRSFIHDIAVNADAHAIVDAVIRLAHALGLKVVAEGVETGIQRDILLRLGCDELQGYLFAKPMTAAALLAWAHGGKPEGATDFSPSVLGGLATP
jgi:diguanylate cyclase (GGDEF)-like protein